MSQLNLEHCESLAMFPKLTNPDDVGRYVACGSGGSRSKCPIWGNLTDPFDPGMGNLARYAVAFSTSRTVFDLWQHNPRPAVSFNGNDVIY